MKNRMLLVTVLTVAVLASGIGVAYTDHLNRQLFVRMQKLQAERDTLEIEWELLQLEQSTLVTDIVVEQRARAQLHMRTPEPDEVLYITPR
ncbi:MAG TPA: cell division protein FtsL [Candidatus Competibacteraceae bacterium]|nr:MAG: cell division protein FtsL [Candidatus Competibacteraceae bacterium]HNW77491.1 cell division protein FtsL [Candidatus Competibacteraceae bacterium]HQC72352.1 cell division protein FtsL [Candidatus Competibacteraceae bacterium]